MFDGKFQNRFGGVGYPSVVEPKEFGPVGSAVAIPVKVFSFEDERKAYEDAGEEPPKNTYESRREIKMREAQK